MRVAQPKAQRDALPFVTPLAGQASRQRLAPVSFTFGVTTKVALDSRSFTTEPNHEFHPGVRGGGRWSLAS